VIPLISTFTVGINSKSFPWPVHSVQETSPNFLRRRTRVYGTADNAEVSQSQTASDGRLLSHVTVGRVECIQATASTQIAERFEPNTVLWTFRTIQPSYLFFRPQIFRRPWSAPHDAVCSEIDYVLRKCSYLPLKLFSKNTNFRQFPDPKQTL